MIMDNDDDDASAWCFGHFLTRNDDKLYCSMGKITHTINQNTDIW